MTTKLNATISDWIYNEIIAKAKNKSERVEELLVKGYLAEKEKELKSQSTDHEAKPCKARGWLWGANSEVVALNVRRAMALA